MKKEEFFKRYSIHAQQFEHFVELGIIDDDHLDENSIHDFSLAMTLEKIGFDNESIKKYVALKNHDEKECFRLLEKHRDGLLDQIHTSQKRIHIIEKTIEKCKKGG